MAEKNKRGPKPHKDRSKVRTADLRSKVLPAERKLVEKAAAWADLSLSDYIRERLLPMAQRETSE